MLSHAPDIYARIRHRLLNLATTLDTSRHETPVPALPLWTVRDTYAHLAGNVADSLTGNVDEQGTAPWTAIHVSNRADHTLADICTEWSGNAEAFDTAMRADAKLWGNAFDLWHHEQDIRAALGEPVDRDETTVRFTIDLLVPAIAAHWPADTPSVRVVADDLDQDWQLGDGTPATTVHTNGYDLSRGLAGRRSRVQLETLGWHNPAPHLAHMPAFDFPEKDLTE
ncbi:maleylpyruvate isomerase family mycothiol-dependent enzyme [Stackebrandtia nassauensis]|uniref:Mycothiol-dependent maleylpyruvate isomerase metal-binding domain-containing protein n=1 Tax=Stackebrandtia nassauensis (strain DSM 44728 / CIP 108903 / NRRL B-16338 / NBRC 102104 / LLR-40K-21) TaxID=446470 RepID=D3Q4P1_STANL|nr:maleylpyruvate isomerase family mycothiol-dependent enzyme [Stackebrandtia nassauensis]ADD42071.1 hypothetical protein Snas_2387 [Stackebrandtia nassauensis DSM 44728]